MAKSIARSVAVRRRAMRAKLRHIGWGVIEVAGGIVLVLALAIGGFYWRLSQGDISVSFITGPVEAAINDRLTGYKVAIGDTVLEQVAGGHGVSLRLKDIVLRAPSGSVIVAAPKAEIGLSFEGLLFGKILPRRIELIGTQLALIYDAGGRLRIGLDANRAEHETAVLSEPKEQSQSYALAAADQNGSGSAAAKPQSFAAAVSVLRDVLAGSNDMPLRTLEEIVISQVQAIFVHERLGRRWSMRNGTIRLSLDSGALAVGAGADLNYQGKPIPLRAQASLSNVEGGVRISGTLSDVNPHDLARSFDAENLFVALDMPVTASFDGEVDADGTLRGGSMDATFGAGFVRVLGGESDGLLVDEAKLRLSYDAGRRVFELQPSEIFSGQTSAVLEGRIFAGPRDGPIPDTWRYDLRAREVRIGSTDVTEQPTSVDGITAQGSYDVLTGVLQLYRGELVAGNAGAAVSAVVAPSGEAARVQAAASISPMSARQLKDIWPSFIADKAREWVLKNVVDGHVTGGTLRVDLDKSNLDRLRQGEVVDPEALRFDFGFQNVTTLFMDEMPPLSLASGRGQIEGRQFSLEAGPGTVKLPDGSSVTLTTGTFRIPQLGKKPADGNFDLSLDGKVSALLALVDHPPLGLLKNWRLHPDTLTGDGKVALSLSMPLIPKLPLQQVQVEAQAELRDVEANKLFNGYGLKKGRILINVKDRVMNLAGEGEVDGISTDISWSVPFNAANDEDTLPILVARLDDAEREKLGLSLPGISGPVTVTFAPNLKSAESSGKLAVFAADLAQAQVDLAAIGIRKPAGDSATLAGELYGDANGYTVDKLEIVSDRLSVLGQLGIDRKGRLQKINLPLLRLSQNDNLTLLAERTAQGRLRATLGGTSFDAALAMANMLGAGFGGAVDSGDPLGDGNIDLTVNLQRVLGKHGAEIRNLTGKVNVEGGIVTALNLEGQTDGGAAVRAVINGDEGKRRKLRLVCGNAGAAFRFVGAYKRVEGGTVSLDMNLPDEPGQSAQGLLKAENFYIRGEPVIRSISDSTPVLAEAPTRIDSSRIRFDHLRMPFATAPGRIILSETVLRGPSVGGSVEGEINFAANRLDLAGTYVPAYAVNNLLSHVPIFGRVLTGGENGGLVGVTFAMRGSIEDPAVTINPVSAITPGLFRKIFDFAPSSARKAESDTRRVRPAEPIPVQ